jgi:hypothetical protein
MNTHSRSIMAPCGETIAPPTVRAQLRPTPTGRRGVLLLVVLSMLTLFLMLGAAYLVAATRAREAARAYARLTLGSDDARVPHAQLLDFVLLRAIRGPAIPAGMVGVAPVSFESLLADKYGAGSISGTATNITQTGPIIEITLSSTNNVRPTDLCGRVLTFAEPGRAATSHRIIRARAIDDTSPNPVPVLTNTPSFTLKLSLDTPILKGPFTKPSAGRIVVNGREFAGAAGDANESWDGFGADNPFLAQVGTATISTSTVTRVSYLPGLVTTLLSGTWDYDNDGIPDAADNDNDGVWDGAFLDVGIPDTVDGNGNAVRLRASVLIVDLDGRFNVNAHDSMARIAYAGTNLWPGVASASTPIGSGYGPADVNGGKMFSTLTSGSENPALMAMAGGTSTWLSGTRGTGSRFTSGGSTPRLDVVEGRYGRDRIGLFAPPITWPLTSGTTLVSSTYSLPGVVGTNDEPSRTNDRRADWSQGMDVSNGFPTVWWTGSTSFNWATTLSGNQPLPRGVFNSPPDLHGRMRTTGSAAVGSAAVPKLIFEKPEWSNSSFESTDDPYELAIDTRTGRGGWLHDPSTSGVSPTAASYSDNPFLPADLEPVLRPYDGDTNRLALRLAAMLGSAAEDSRLKVTTDSWDTTAVTGAAARLIYGGSDGPDWLQTGTTSGAFFGTSAITGILGGEIARGERFDLNRPLTNAKPSAYNHTNLYYVQRQAYFKDLYTLLVALGEPANATTAQWAANVVEFRDADSTMTPFEYDTNPADGWDVDNDARNSSGDAKSEQREVLWGAERPEMLITETSAWEDDTTGELFIMLHRPWNAIAYGKDLVTGGTTSIAGEPIDPDLDSSSASPTNVLDLGRKSGTQAFTSGTTYPIWRLRIVDTAGNAKYVRLDTNVNATDTLVSSTITSAAATPKVGADGWLCLQGSNTLVPAATISFSGTVLMGASFRVPGTPVAPGTDREATVYLERLTDPTALVSTSVNATAWTQDPLTANTVPMYRIVDQARITVKNRKLDGVVTPSVNRRQKIDFWKPVFSGFSNYVLSGTNMAGGGGVWFPWPNRPFVSSAELFLVPGREQLDLLTNYARPTAASNDLVSMAVPQLFDAVHVPTRFAGIHRGYTTDYSSSTGIFNEMTPVNQLSSFREPGRVNLNTVVADDVWNAVVAGPLAAAAVSRSTAAFTTTQARSMANLLALSGASTVVVSDTNSVTTVLAHDRNPLHELYTATRLANTVTPRSNVFAIWVTLRESTANDPDSVKYRRAFYIVDRSIPVGFEEGKDHNVHDMIRLRRIIE